MKADDLQALSKTSAGPEMGRVKESEGEHAKEVFVCLHAKKTTKKKTYHFIHRRQRREQRQVEQLRILQWQKQQQSQQQQWWLQRRGEICGLFWWPCPESGGLARPSG